MTEAFRLVNQDRKFVVCSVCGNNSFIEFTPAKVGCANTKCRHLFKAIGLSPSTKEST